MSLAKTITTIFLVPTLGITKESLLGNGFINAYMKDDLQDNQYPVDVIFLLFKPNDLNKFREFLISEYSRTTDIIDDYDYQGGYVVVVYKLRDSIKNDILLIKQGLYSKTSEGFQMLFPKTVEIKRGGTVKKEVSLQRRIFKKSPDLREYWENKIGQHINPDQEVWETFSEEKEVLNLKNINDV